jgi:hypothetical protein
MRLIVKLMLRIIPLLVLGVNCYKLLRDEDHILENKLFV